MNKISCLIYFVLGMAINTEAFSQKLPNLIPYRDGKLWGYCDSNKKIIIKPKYDLSKPEYKGFVIFPHFGDETQQETISLGIKEIIINRKGKELERPKPLKPVIINGAIQVPEGYQPKPIMDNNILATEYFSYGLKNSDILGICKYKVPVHYKKDGYEKYKSFRCYLATDSTKTLIDEHDSVIFKGYKFIWLLDTVFLLVDKNEKWLIGNRYGKIITDILYDEIEANITLRAGVNNHLKWDDDKRIYSASWGRFLVVRKGIYYGVITLDGKQVIPTGKYKYITSAEKRMYGIFYAYYDKNDGYIDYKGTQYWKGQNAGKPTPNAGLIYLPQ